MSILRVTLLGRFEATWDGAPLAGLEHAKARELFSYLLLNRDRPNSREIVANHLWGGHYTTEVSKKYLRKALWQLNESLAGCSDEIREELICADSNWIQLKSIEPLWLDVAFVDNAYKVVKGIHGSQITLETAKALSKVVRLCKGELLEGQYHDWSFADGIRFRQVVLILLDKLIDHSVAHGQFESALEHGDLILRHDPARELTHLNLMRAYHALGDRTSAIRQYRRCCEALREDLDVAPSRDVVELYNRMRMGEAAGITLVQGAISGAARRGSNSLSGAGLDLISFDARLGADRQKNMTRLAAEVA